MKFDPRRLSPQCAPTQHALEPVPLSVSRQCTCASGDPNDGTLPWARQGSTFLFLSSRIARNIRAVQHAKADSGTIDWLPSRQLSVSFSENMHRSFLENGDISLFVLSVQEGGG